MEKTLDKNDAFAMVGSRGAAPHRNLPPLIYGFRMRIFGNAGDKKIAKTQQGD